MQSRAVFGSRQSCWQRKFTTKPDRRQSMRTRTRTELPPRRAAKWTLTHVGLARHLLLAMLQTCALSLHLLTFAVDSHTFA